MCERMCRKLLFPTEIESCGNLKNLLHPSSKQAYLHVIFAVILGNNNANLLKLLLGLT